MARIMKHLPLSNVVISDRFPLNPRTLALVDHLRSGGTVPPIHVDAGSFGYYFVLDGRHRYVAHKLCGRPTILCRFGTLPKERGGKCLKT